MASANATTRMQAPKGISQVTVEQQNFKVNKDGFVTVPDPFVGKLKDIGFKVGPFVVEVSAETAAAIKATAAAAANDATKANPDTLPQGQQRNAPKTD